MLKVWSSCFFGCRLAGQGALLNWCPCKALAISLSNISEWKTVLIEGLVDADACCKVMAMLVKMKGEGLGQGYVTKLCEGPTIYNSSL